ncbi:MYND-type zinc finger-containing chromatin reader Zmynd8-like [Sitodiplosis mosellana]|uniref:MYND-type zinc finger-containing chromatin reader Zmynd8-like n=1 Tax=Sitodiplosis mosellana TaxID=263140 RepID=UPI002443FABA|nr:MYND-type zinc finger-containing chromatin reader Zmynd8-like [Sitodiplosis mosellana]
MDAGGLRAMKDKSYSSFDDFKADIKEFTELCKKKHPNSKEVKKSSVKLVKVVASDLKYIKLCAQCYRNGIKSANSMIELCDPLHLLIWGKTEGFNYWPAKLMSVQGRKANVIYFGEFLNAQVNVEDCLIYTEKRPDIKARIVEYDLFKVALKDAEKYISNIKEKYGFFNYAERIVHINPEKLTEHCDNMIKPIEEPEILTVPPSASEQVDSTQKQNHWNHQLPINFQRKAVYHTQEHRGVI